MALPAAPTPTDEQPHSLRLHLWWTAALVLAALGGAGLAVAVDRPGNPVQRPELTYRADEAARQWVDLMASQLTTLSDDAAHISDAGREALGHLQSLDLESASAVLDSGDAYALHGLAGPIDSFADVLAELRSTQDAAHRAIDRWRLGPTMVNLFDQIAAAIIAADELPNDWSTLAGTGRTVIDLVSALNGHDAAVFQATISGRDSRWNDALILLNGAAGALDAATTARDQLAQSTTVDTLDDLLGRERAYDAALADLYQFLADGGSQSGDRFDALKKAVDRTQAALPSDTSALVVIVGEASGAPIADKLLAMEKVRGAINDALQAISDAQPGAQATDSPLETPPPVTITSAP